MKFKIDPKENLYLIFMILAGISIYGIILYNLEFKLGNKSIIYACLIGVFAIFHLLGSLLLIGYLKGNAIKINKLQFPEIFEILESHSKKLDLKTTPEMYLLQGGGLLNAFAIKFSRRNYVVLYSDVLEIAYQEGIDAVSFIIGHELGHIKRNHTGSLKSLILLPSKFIPFLGEAYSRACEYTCDNIGYNLCPEGALKGALVLAAGKKLYKKIDIRTLLLNVTDDSNFVISFAEVFSTHPALIKRIATINRLNHENLTPEAHAFFSPNIDIKQSEINQ